MVSQDCKNNTIFCVTEIKFKYFGDFGSMKGKFAGP